MNETMGIFVGLVLVIVYLLLLGLGLADYIMTSYSLYNLAKRRFINNAWLAWIPVGNTWIIGALANNYDLKNGYDRRWQKILITLALIFFAGFVMFYALFIFSIFKITMQSAEIGTVGYDVIGMTVIAYIGIIIFALVAAAWNVCQTICIYKIFESTVPEKAVKYILCYTLIPLGGAICLLKSYKKGYPEEILEENSCQE